MPIKEILVMGERHTGTNLIRLIINRNAGSVKCLRDFEGGPWKHGFFDSSSFLVQPGQLLLVVTRDVFTWLPKMYKETYCNGFPRQRKISFSDFIRLNYECAFRKGAFERGGKNLIELRTHKYKHWLKDTSFFGFGSSPNCARRHVRYESVLEQGQEETIGSILKGHGILNSSEFEPVVGHTSWNGEDSTAPFSPESHQTILRLYTEKDFRFILDSLDMDFEKNMLNYTYDYVKVYLNGLQ